MKVILLAGGLGTRLSEETQLRPKPMVEIGGIPILVHIMRSYAHFGLNEFVVALGYKGEIIKEYFLNYHLRNSDLTINLASGGVEYSRRPAENMKVELVDTGGKTMTGGRLRRLEAMMRPKGTFMLTYGDGVSDVDIAALLAFHRRHGKLATVTAVRPAARFGVMAFDGDRVTSFQEKPQTTEGWINGGYFVLEPGVFDYLKGDETILEKEPLEGLARDGQLMAYKHHGFWHPMDTIRDRDALNELWASGQAPWSGKAE
ncbi:MAG TPA: glucose-1-phosphate cytidylyltransferase [Lacunisphaera sp.]|nr:glucose-1-phosphate cytidylyltransferase [Lacunisphaera sp.]